MPRTELKRRPGSLTREAIMWCAEVGLGAWARKGFVGWIERLNAENNEEGYLMIVVRPEEYI